jgi:exodeoxyribonuclease VII small subunit
MTIQSNESESFQKMVSDVESIITRISSQNIDLDEVLEQTEEGYKLLSSMKKRLSDAKERIEQLKLEYEPDASNSH